MKRQRPDREERCARGPFSCLVNTEGPVQKLTTGLLATYRAINQRYYHEKQTRTRKCRLWRLMLVVSQYREMLRACAPEEISGCWVRFSQHMSRWEWRGSGQSAEVHEKLNWQVELIAQTALKGVGEHSSLAQMKRALERLSQRLEILKLQDQSSVDSHGHYMAETGELLDNGRYVIMAHCGSGAFCKVWRGLDRSTGERVCIKIIGNRKLHSEQSQREIKILKFLAQCQSQGPGAQGGGVVQLQSSFVFMGHHCLVFPMLAYDLYELLKNESFRGISLKLVRKFAVQILQTLAMLAQPSVQLVHCDLKPENIMVVKHNQTKIRVIDFGSSCFCDEQGSTYVQSRFYRSPEALLGLKLNCQIDMWSFGCILFELYTGRPLFTGKNAKDQLMRISGVLGRPPKHMLSRSGMYGEGTKEGVVLGAQAAPMDHSDRFRALGYAVISNRSNVADISVDSNGRVTDETFLHLVDLVTKCLEVDPENRIQPKEALMHPFIQNKAKRHPAPACVPGAVAEHPAAVELVHNCTSMAVDQPSDHDPREFQESQELTHGPRSPASTEPEPKSMSS